MHEKYVRERAGGGVCSINVPEHLVRHVGIRHLRVADHHGLEHAGLFRVRRFARQAGAVLPSAVGGHDHEPGHELSRHRPREREGAYSVSSPRCLICDRKMLCPSVGVGRQCMEVEDVLTHAIKRRFRKGHSCSGLAPDPFAIRVHDLDTNVCILVDGEPR